MGGERNEEPEDDGSPLRFVPVRPFSVSEFWAIFHLLAGVFAPAIAILYSFSGAWATWEEPFQSGRAAHYAAVLLAFPAMYWFLALVVPPMISQVVHVTRPHSSGLWWVRAGIYSGTLISLQFLVLVSIASGPLPMILGLAGALFVFAPVAFGIQIVSKYLFGGDIFKSMAACAIFCSLPFLIQQLLAPSRNAWNPFQLLTIVVAPAPLLCFTSYAVLAAKLAAAGHLLKTPRTGIVTAVAGWLIIFFGCWQRAVQTMYSEYAKLPTDDPNCFVSAAAANGHRFLTRSWEVDGPRCRLRVNRQMQYLKFLEFALAAAMPTVHGKVRRVYNRLGPPLADWTRGSRWRADIAWLSLVPLVLVAMIIRIACRFPMENIRRLYSGNRLAEKCPTSARNS